MPFKPLALSTTNSISSERSTEETIRTVGSFEIPILANQPNPEVQRKRSDQSERRNLETTKEVDWEDASELDSQEDSERGEETPRRQKRIRPAPIAEFWMTYCKPTCMILSIIFLLSNPDFWNVLTRDFESAPNLKNIIIAISDRQTMRNENMSATVPLVALGITIPNFIEVLILRYFKERVLPYPEWRLLGAQDLMMVVATGFTMIVGHNTLTCQIILTLRQAVLVPMFMFRNWMEWTTPWKVWAISLWVILGFVFLTTVFSWFLVYIWITPAAHEAMGAILYLLSIIVLVFLAKCVQEIYVIVINLESKELLIFGDDEDDKEPRKDKMEIPSAESMPSSTTSEGTEAAMQDV